jgi:hypothetical protein
MFERYNFSGDFQDLLLACIMKHPKMFLHNAGTLNSAYFEGVERTATARALFAYWRKNGRFPTEEALGQIVYDSIIRSTEAKEEDNVMAYVRKLRDMDTGDAQYVVERVVQFAKERAIFIAIQKSYDFLKSGETPPGGFSRMFEDALKIGMNLEDLGYKFWKDYPDEFAKIMEKIKSKDYGTPTGFSDLDKLWPFGWGPGWLISILAPPKRYKTAFCINLAMNIVTEFKKPVLYYPCEITQELAAVRCACNLTNTPSDFVYKNPNTFAEIATQAIIEKCEKPLIIKGFPARAATIAGDIRSHALTVCQQFQIQPGAIFIDFAETVKSTADPKRTSEWRAQGEIYLEARALGAEFKCPVILPDRCNKETVGHAVPSMKSFQGSFEKAGIVDVAIGLCASDQEYMDNIIRYFVFLNRHGEAFQHYRGEVDPTAMKMSILEKIEWNPEEDDGGGDRQNNRRPNRNRNRRAPAPVDRIG